VFAGAGSDEQNRNAINVSVTGLLSGGELSINVDPTKFDVAAGTGVVVDNHTDPLNPTLTTVSWTAFTAEVPTLIGTEDQSEIAINSAGAIVQQATLFTFEQSRDLIILGRLVHPDNVNIIATLMKPRVAFNRDMESEDFLSIIGPLNASGNVVSPTGANLNIDKSAGETFRIGTNYTNSKKRPSITSDPLATALTFSYRWRDGGGGWTRGTDRTTIDPNSYDDGDGTLGTVPNNNFTIQTIFFFGATNSVFLQYGQTVYNTLAAAEAALNDPFDVDPNFAEATFRAWLIVQEGATDLSNPAQAKFITAGVFGLNAIGVPGAGGTGAVPTSLNKNMDALLTAADGQQAVATGISATPPGDGHVAVLVNGHSVTVGDGVKTEECYFSGDGGVTARPISDIQASDELFWNGSIALYELEIDDKVDFVYNV
jgi:hypothetical protein